MKFIKTEIEGLIVIEPKIFKDDRGYFYESYNYDLFKENGIRDVFVQDNESLSQKKVLRGLHFQIPPFSQAKLIRVVQGKVLDVAVDLRKESETYGKHYSIELSADNKKMFFIPEGFAHGFLALEDNTIFSYKCSNVYNKESEDSLFWKDTDLNIDWGIEDPLLSGKDKYVKSFHEFKTQF
jgi:dTDP-4-dehydrorhamnose 3,5-epimerase